MTFHPEVVPSAELSSLYARVEAGIEWLLEHDPLGAFHLWFTAGLSPLSPMPAQDAREDGPDRRARWTAYHEARTLFERLWRQMEAKERKEGIVR